MNITIYLALLGWIPVTFFLFAVLPGRRAVLVSTLGGWLFLPMAGIPISGPMPDLSKGTVVALGMFAAVMTLDGGRLFSLRFRWIDLPMAVWCLWPLFSSISIGLGAYAGFAAALSQILGWGIPYLMGRIYFGDREALRELLIGVCVAGLIYMPLCWYEIRMSPQLHHIVYGFNQHSFSQTKRYGGYRPQVFLQHGLAVGIFMASATVAAIGVWLGRLRYHVFLLSPGVAALLLAITTLLGKSTGSIVLMVAAIAALLATKRGQRAWPVLLMLAMAPIYVTGRINNTPTTDTVVTAAAKIFGGERAGSVRVRLESEDALLKKAKRRPLLGWGAWGYYRVDDQGVELAQATDGFWTIVFGKYGLPGLVAFLMVLILPPVLVLRGHRRRGEFAGVGVTLSALCLMQALQAFDSMLNAMHNPLFLVIAGALASASFGPLSSNVLAAASGDAARRT